MYTKIGKKIKTLATALAIIIAIVCAILGFVFILNEAAGLGCIVLFGGPLVAWISSFFMYGFGELIDTNQQLLFLFENRSTPMSQKKIFNQEANASEPKKDSKLNRTELDQLFKKGLISEEEYQNAIEGANEV